MRETHVAPQTDSSARAQITLIAESAPASTGGPGKSSDCVPPHAAAVIAKTTMFLATRLGNGIREEEYTDRPGRRPRDRETASRDSLKERMADPTIVLLIIVGLTAADRPRGSVVSTAVGSGLATDARILVEERTSTPTDGEATSTAERLGGSAIAEISWGDGAHGRARLHVYLASDRAWYDQELTFDALDAPEDRERSIGLLVGAMIRARQSEEAGAAAAPAVAAPPPPAPALAPAILPSPPVAEQPGPMGAPAARLWRVGFDVGGLGMAGISGEAPGLGPSVRARFVLNRALSLHGGVALGFGSLTSAGADLTTTRIALGGRFRFARLAKGSVGLDAGLEGLAVHHVVRRAAPEASRDRWLSGGHVDLGAAFALAPALEVFATVGLDVVAGATPITLGGERAAEIPPVRGTIEAGARLFF